MNFSAPLSVIIQLSGMEYHHISGPDRIYNIAVYMNMDLFSPNDSLGVTLYWLALFPL